MQYEARKDKKNGQRRKKHLLAPGGRNLLTLMTRRDTCTTLGTRPIVRVEGFQNMPFQNMSFQNMSFQNL